MNIRKIAVHIDDVIKARDGLEDSGLTDRPDVQYAVDLLRSIVDGYHGTTWGAMNQTTGQVIEAVGQSTAEQLVDDLNADPRDVGFWRLAAARNGKWEDVSDDTEMEAKV